jgi:uncharacterized lipoprotein YddW (UPF0748 family)
VVKRYDVDGVHIDDYFYPYRETRTITRRVKKKRVREKVEVAFPDDKTWKKFGKPAGFSSRDDWRRANIDGFIESLYKNVKSLKPAMLVGISPFGIWRPGHPPGISGLDAYNEIYADSRRWLREGWLDYVAPQLYWPVGGTQDRFRELDAWWRSENIRGRYVWPALYTSHVYGGNDAWPMSEINTEIESIRDSRVGSADVPGEVHFRLGALFANDFRLAKSLSGEYREVALVPAFPWLGANAPAAPRVTLGAGTPISFTIERGDTATVRWWLVQARSPDGQWTTTLRPAGEGQLAPPGLGAMQVDEIAVTAIGPTGVASLPAIVTP